MAAHDDPQTNPAAGTVAGLELLEELGRGAQTVVHRARKGELEVAVKLLRSDARHRSEHARQVFRREASVLASLRDEGLVRIYETGVADGLPYLVMQLLEGRTLAALLAEREVLAVDEVIEVGVAAAGALAAAHRAGLVHRDVKPHNVIVQPDGRVKVIDFGLVEQAGAGAGGDAVAGTVAYSAPEQTGMLRRPVDGRADLYALGVTLFACATGMLPFSAADPAGLMRLHAVAPPPDPAALRPELPPPLAAIITKLLAKDPDDRYQTGEGLAADLRRVAAGGAGFPLGADDDQLAALTTALVGRDAELAELDAAWAEAVAGHGALALVTGPPGGGKSRLVHELVLQARAEGRLVLAGTCPRDPVPLAVLRDAIDAHIDSLRRLPAAGAEAAGGLLRAAAGPSAALLKGLSPRLAEVFADAPDLPDDGDRSEQVAAVLAQFLAALATQAGGALLCLDDVQWLDEASRAVLRRLAAQLAAAPLLVACTARDDDDSAGALARFEADTGQALATSLRLGPLEDAAVARLVAELLGGAEVDERFAGLLAVRSGGNPFALAQYVRAVVDAGLVRPSWGRWTVDGDDLDDLRLPGDVLQLVLARVDRLAQPAREALTAAAAIGRRFPARLLAEVRGQEPEQGPLAVAEAAAAGLVEPRGGGEYAFVHDRVREALLSRLDGPALAELHQAIAETLDRRDPVAGDRWHAFALARHYALGVPGRSPVRVFETSAAAGRLALDSHAVADAVAHFQRAVATAIATPGATPDAALWEAFGLACLRAGRGEARDYLERALELEADQRARARILTHLAYLEYGRWDNQAALYRVDQGLRELGAALPRSTALLALTSLWWFAAGLVLGWLRIRPAGGIRHERHRHIVMLNTVGSHAAFLDLKLPRGIPMVLRSLYSLRRLGPSREMIELYSTFGALAGILQFGRLSARIFARAKQVAADLADPQLAAYSEFLHAHAQNFAGDTVASARSFRRVLDTDDRWLAVHDHLFGFVVLAGILGLRGDTRELLRRFEVAEERASHAEGTDAEGAGHLANGMSVLSVLGRHAEAEHMAARIRAMLERTPESALRRASFLLFEVQVHTEQGDFGPAFDATLAQLETLGLRQSLVPMPTRVLWCYQAHARLAQYAAAAPAQRAALLPVARKAVKDLGKAAKSDLLRAHHRVAKAALAQLTGDHKGALASLARLEPIAHEVESAWVEHEIARVRARALRALGAEAGAQRQARLALELADEHGWAGRGARVRAEFPDAARSGALTGSATSGGGSGEVAVDEGRLRHKRHLDALLQVGRAASTVLEPAELARVALDEILRILGAERAHLLLSGPGGELESAGGRDADGNDVPVLTGYSSSVVERVRVTGEPVVVTGTDDGLELTSESAVTHGLRSIIAVPLALEGRLLGVVYLDSRLARGVFTADDADILGAIAAQVALSIETARAAQLEVAVQAERQRATLAESLRDSLASVSGTLDPERVLGRLLDTAAGLLGYQAGCVALGEGEKLHVAAVAGAVDPGAAGRRVALAGEPVLAAQLRAPGPGPVAGAGGCPLAGVLGPARSWLSVPLAVRGVPAGVLVLGFEREAPGKDAAGIAAALAGQGAVAYENALLFSQVQQLATVDELTSVANRRSFFEAGDELFAAGRGSGLPVTAVMVDVDHFKRINDAHGHGVGDEVIREVAQRLGRGLRRGDVLGRYGGEEFALVISGHEWDAVQLGERLRAAVAARPVPTSAGPLAVTASVGVAVLAPGDASLEVLLDRADQALYEAKRAGRDRVVEAA